MPIKRSPDYLIVASAVTLLVIGIVMIYSSSAVLASERFGNPYFYLKKQTFGATIGIILMIAAMRFDYRLLRKYCLYFYLVSVALLIIVLVPGIGHEVNGAQRWLSIAGFSFQPSEFVKLAMLIFFAGYLAKKKAEGKIEDLQFGFVPSLLALSLVLALIHLQPDLGTAVILALIIFLMFFISGIRITHLMGTALVMLPLVVVSIFAVNYRKRRILSFLDPWEDATDSGYQIIQSFVAMNNGGLWGEGLGASQQKLFFLPEPHTDFIFSIITEELGFIGALLVLAIFALLIWRGFQVGMKVPDSFGSLLAFGITFAIAAQAVVNIAVTVGLLPTKGLPLPFISLGGSALVMWMTSIGILTNISEHAK